MQYAVGQGSGIPALPYHPACHKQAFHPRCAVCAQWVPDQPGGRIVWSEVPFWGDRFCPGHQGDGTLCCTACTRLQPRREEWAALDDGRVLCLACMDTVVVGQEESQALYTQAGWWECGGVRGERGGVSLCLGWPAWTPWWGGRGRGRRGTGTPRAVPQGLGSQVLAAHSPPALACLIVV